MRPVLHITIRIMMLACLAILNANNAQAPLLIVPLANKNFIFRIHSVTAVHKYAQAALLILYAQVALKAIFCKIQSVLAVAVTVHLVIQLQYALLVRLDTIFFSTVALALSHFFGTRLVRGVTDVLLGAFNVPVLFTANHVINSIHIKVVSAPTPASLNQNPYHHYHLIKQKIS